VKKLFLLLFSWRIWLFLPVFLASVLIPFRSNSSFTQLWHYVSPYRVAEYPAVYPWANFDGVHYVAIASRGYLDEGRFMPLFPLFLGFAVGFEKKDLYFKIFLCGSFLLQVALLMLFARGYFVA